MTVITLPRPMFWECAICGDGASYEAAELYWISHHPGWCCEECISDYYPDSHSDYSLEKHLKGGRLALVLKEHRE